ncbi:MAG: SIS domain-containing protein [Burkholderiales bacterium]|nr:SIS domain-containing protein [Burkholderiales bacterium]
MRAEALQAPAAAEQLLAADGPAYAALSASLQSEPPRAIVTLARGSSDHAAHYLAYLVMSRLGQLVTSLPMSLLTLHAAPLRSEGLLSLALSQSGQSPDLVLPTEHFRRGGARTVALVNDTASPLARAAQWVLPLHAGAETSVAASKSVICQLVAGARLVAAWQGDTALAQALQALPEALAQAARADGSAALPVLASAERLYVVSRGTGLSAALETALKLKETCGIQAEAFSGAELRHGPMALVDDGYPVLVLALRGPTQPGLLALADELRRRGAAVLLAAPAGVPGVQLPLHPAPDPVLDPITALQSLYLLADALARLRGLDPDHPRHLSKVTRTR